MGKLTCPQPRPSSRELQSSSPEKELEDPLEEAFSRFQKTGEHLVRVMDAFVESSPEALRMDQHKSLESTGVLN